MRSWKSLAGMGLLLGAGFASAQEPIPSPGTSAVKEPTGAAATVNGEAIAEADVQRALRSVPAVNHAAARPEIIGFMIDNKLVDQYLAALKIEPDPKEVDALLAKLKAEVAEKKQDWGNVLKQMQLTEPEMKAQLSNQLRWEKFIEQQATDAKFQAQFDANLEVFDGTRVKARHILLSPGKAETGTAEATAQLKKLQGRNRSLGRRGRHEDRPQARRRRPKAGQGKGTRRRLRRSRQGPFNLPVEGPGRRPRLVPARRRDGRTVRPSLVRGTRRSR